MSTGKQLSFASGEVSPEFQFNSQEVSYATGLKKLKNGYVRKQGGVSNRAGFMQLRYNPQINDSSNQVPGTLGTIYDFAINEQGLGPNITSFSFWNNIDKRWDFLELGYFDTLNPTVLRSRYNFDPSTVAVSPLDISIEDPGGGGANTYTIRHSGIENFKFVALDDCIVLFPYIWYDVNFDGSFLTKYPINICFDLNSKTWKPFGIRSEDKTQVDQLFTTVTKSVGKSPFLPAGYYITIERSDGYEYLIDFISTTVADIATWNSESSTNPAPWYPHPQVSNFHKSKLISQGLEGGELIRYYRASWGKDPFRQFFKLVGVSSYDPSTLEYTFQDFGAEDPAFTPPTEKGTVVEILQTSGAADPLNFSFRSETLGQATCGAFHQQSLLVYCESVPGGTTPDPDQEVYAKDAFDTFMKSKMNTPKQFTQPIIFSNTEAFSFNISALRNAKKVAILSMAKAVVLTTEGAHILSGSSTQGGITPTEVNPVQISAVGCHEVVEPKVVGTKGYYLSSDGSRLMAIVWDETGQSCKLFEASTYSSHLLEGEYFIRMEALSNKENSVFLLTSMGKLVHITFNFEVVTGGFSSMELEEGYIENIFPLKSKRMFSEDAKSFENSSQVFDTLGAYVIRNGKRSCEMLYLREDSDTLYMNFIDSSVVFGTNKIFYASDKLRVPATFPLRMSVGGAGPWVDDTVCSPNQAAYNRANIGDGTTPDWSAGEIIHVYFENALGTDDPDKTRIDFYYTDAEGNKRFLRGAIDFASETVGVYAGGFTTRYEVTFDEDVPTSLRDVQGQALTTAEKNAIQTYFNFAYSFLPQAVLKKIYDRRPASIASGDPVTVALYADRWLVSSPLNPDYATKNVQITFDGVDYGIDFGGDFYTFGFIGYPYEMKAQTLPIEASDNRTLKTGNVIAGTAGMGLYKTMGGWVGKPDTDTEDMAPMLSKYPQVESFNQLPAPYTGYDEYSIPSEWKEGVIEFRQVDPLPFTLLSVYPKGQASY
jgi:hypothetical protein